MPNGGVPMHMALYPRDGADMVLYCKGGVLLVFDRIQWDTHKSQGAPRATLSKTEGAALAWFLRYWLGDAALRPGYNMRQEEVQAEFDF
jgi:hypothetical protein